MTRVVASTIATPHQVRPLRDQRAARVDRDRAAARSRHFSRAAVTVTPRRPGGVVRAPTPRATHATHHCHLCDLVPSRLDSARFCSTSGSASWQLLFVGKTPDPYTTRHLYSTRCCSTIRTRPRTRSSPTDRRVTQPLRADFSLDETPPSLSALVLDAPYPARDATVTAIVRPPVWHTSKTNN